MRAIVTAIDKLHGIPRVCALSSLTGRPLGRATIFGDLFGELTRNRSAMQRVQPTLSRLLPESREASVALASATGLALLLGYLLFVTPAQQERALVRRARTLSPHVPPSICGRR